jgi:hypothetical protein
MAQHPRRMLGTQKEGNALAGIIVAFHKPEHQPATKTKDTKQACETH